MMKEKKQQHLSLAPFFLRVGLALVLLYAAIAAFLNPGAWEVYVPSFIGVIVPLSLFLTLFALYQAVLALWLLSGKYTFYAAVLAAVTLLGIIFPNIADLDVIFRDVAIFFEAVALAFLTYPSSKR